jgi:hypothetical protein
MVRNFLESDRKWSQLVIIGIENDLGQISTKFHIAIFSLELFHTMIFEIIRKSKAQVTRSLEVAHEAQLHKARPGDKPSWPNPTPGHRVYRRIVPGHRP